MFIPVSRCTRQGLPDESISAISLHSAGDGKNNPTPRIQPGCGCRVVFIDIAGNVSLYAAAQGLAAWFHNCDKTGLTQRLGLRVEQRVLFAQSIGYPAKE
jgi:hypothetical protein